MSTSIMIHGVTSIKIDPVDTHPGGADSDYETVDVHIMTDEGDFTLNLFSKHCAATKVVEIPRILIKQQPRTP